MSDFIIIFADENPFLFGFCMYFVFKTFWLIARMPFRVFLIWKHGWPPLHVDADGDFVKTNDRSSEGGLR